MKKALTIIAILGAAMAAYIVLFPTNNPLKKLFTKPATGPDNATPGDPIVPNVPNVPSASASASPYRLGFPLAKGSKGTYVLAIQAALNKKFNTSLTLDGIFGPKTYRALSVNGFNPDAVTFTDYQKIIA